MNSDEATRLICEQMKAASIVFQSAQDRSLRPAEVEAVDAAARLLRSRFMQTPIEMISMFNPINPHHLPTK